MEAPITFVAGSSTLDASDRARLRTIANRVHDDQTRLFVTGFARKGGGAASELASISTARARALATELSRLGVRFWIRYWGAGSLNGSGGPSDRRVEIRASTRDVPRSLVP